MKTKTKVRCAVYTRKSTSEGLEQDFNSLDAQREAAISFIASQKSQLWEYTGESYDDGGFSGGNIERPAFARLMRDVEDGCIDCIVVYKIDRLSRSLIDFVKIMDTFERKNVSLVSITQNFNTTTSMGRLTLNILLSFAQFERELVSERTSDKIAAARRKGKWTGGHRLLGYDIHKSVSGGRLVVNEQEAGQVKEIFDIFTHLRSITAAIREINSRGIVTKRYLTKDGKPRGGEQFEKAKLKRLLKNVIYAGKIKYKDCCYDGEHEAVIDIDTFELAQSILKENSRPGGKRTSKYDILLRSLVKCKSCGCTMGHHYSQKANKRYRYYVCLNAQKRGWAVCPSPSLPAAELERFVVEQIKPLIANEQIINDIIKEAQKIMRRTLAELQSKRQRLSRRASQSQNDKEYARELTKLDTQISALKRGLLEPDELIGNIENFEPMWNSLTPSQQENVVHLLIKQIQWDSENAKIDITFHNSEIAQLQAVGE